MKWTTIAAFAAATARAVQVPDAVENSEGGAVFRLEDELLKPVIGVQIVPRQDSDKKDSGPASSITKNPEPTKTAASNGDDNKDSGDDKKDDKSKSSSSGKSKEKATKTMQSIPQNAPYGGVSMISPTPGISQLYRVGENLTWKWGYTSLSVEPSQINLYASVTPVGQSPLASPITLATDVDFEPTQVFTWDSGKFAKETGGLVVGNYMLIVLDAGEPDGVHGTAKPGHLGLQYNEHTWGMYTPQPTQTLDGPIGCLTCSAAGSNLAGLQNGLLAACTLTIASFLWFIF